MKRQRKWAILLAGLALTCGVTVGCGKGHEHDYTAWGSSETQHWKECPDDGEKNDSTVADHGAPDADGKCPDCGYQLVTHTHSYTEWGSSLTHHWKQCPDDGEVDAATKVLHGKPDADGKCPDCKHQIVTYIDQQFKFVLRKDGTNTPISSLNGISVKLEKSGATLVENTDYTLEKGENNVLTIKGIVSDNYTVTIVTADSEYRYSGAIKLDGAQKELVLQYNYAIASAQSYYVDLTHMNDSERLLAINASSVDEYWQWNAAVPEITLNLADTVQNSKTVKLEFNLKADKTNNKPNNAFGIVMAEGYRGLSLSLWDTAGENDGIKLNKILGQKLGDDLYKQDDAATLKWLETAIYGDGGVDVRVVRANHTIKYFAKQNGKWVPFTSLACAADAKTDIKFMGAGSDFRITNIDVDAEYTDAESQYSAKLSVLDADDNKVVLAEGAKGVLIAGDTRYEVDLTADENGDYGISGSFAQGLYTLGIVGDFNNYTSPEIRITDAMENATIKLAAFAEPTVYDPNKAENIQLADCVTVDDGSIGIEGTRSSNGFWQWGRGNTVPAATLNLSNEIKSSRNVRVDFKLKATKPNNQPNNAFGIAMTEFHEGAALSFWNVKSADNDYETDGIYVRDLKGTWLGEDGWGDDKNGTFKWLEKAVYGTGANLRIERVGANITLTARKDGEWITIHEVECYEYADTMVKFLGIGSDYEISGIKVRIPKEDDAVEYDVTAGFEGDAHGYSVSVDPTVEEGDSAVLVIETSDANKAWGYFPNSVKVNGVTVDFANAVRESLGANRCRYTLEIDVTQNTSILVGVAKGTQVAYSAAVNADAMGSVVCDMENDGKVYYWNDACTLTLTANEGHRLKEIVIGEGADAKTITEGWDKNGLTYKYTFTVTGDVKVVANFEATPQVDCANIKINLLDKNGDNVVIEDGAKLLFIGDYTYELALTKNQDGTYTATGSVYEGEYDCCVSGIYYGYGETTVEIVDGTPTVTISFDEIAVATKYHHGDNNGMGECDFETLIEIGDDTVKINTAEANGKVVDAFWCWNSPVPEASLTLSPVVESSTNVQLTFNLKAVKPNNQPNNAFGIVMAAGYKGVNMSFWNTTNDVDGVWCRALKVCVLGNDEFADDKNNTDDWIEVLAYGENGVNIRAIRNGASLAYFAENADGEWTKFFQTTCAADAKTDIKFLGMGSDYTVSAIAIALPEDAVTSAVSVTEQASGSIATDKTEYYVNEECTVTVTAAENYELKQLVIGDGAAAQTITSGWKQNGNVYTYSFIVVGDVKVVATLEKTSVNVTLDITGEDIADDATVSLKSKKDGTEHTFVKSEGISELIPGEYDVFVYGYQKTTMTVPADGGAVRIALVKTIAYASANDAKGEITVDDTDKTVAIKGSGVADRIGKREIFADLVLTDAQKAATEVEFTFNVKNTKQYRNGDDWAASRFGVQMGGGAIGFFVFLREERSADVVKLATNSLDLNTNQERKWHGDDPTIKWINAACYSADGLNVKVVRTNGKIHIYAQNGEDWVQLDVDATAGNGEPASSGGDLAIADDVQNEIKLLATGDDWTFSNIAITLGAQGGEAIE